MRVEALCVGRSALLPGGKHSAIGKHPVEGRVRIGRLGLAGDSQVDKRHHGGPEMAVHLYPLAHHAFWREELGDHPLLDDPGAFGSNIAVAELDETQVRIGERFRLGEAVLEVSQPRMPCATIERRFERKGMVEAIMESGRCGWYLRVIEEGQAMTGCTLKAIADTGTPYTVRTVFLALANPSDVIETELVATLAECPLLTDDWRAKAFSKLRRHAL